MTAVQQRGVYRDGSGQWTWYDPATETRGDLLPSREEARQQFQEYRKKQPAGATGAGSIAPTPSPEDKVLDEVVERAKPAKKAAAKATKKAAAPKRGRTPGSVAKAWSIFNKMPKAKRKEVLALCEKAGININTAKTQYQRWLHRDTQEGK